TSAQATDRSTMMISHDRRNIDQTLKVRNSAGRDPVRHAREGG
ncbi:helix-turn-helix transcriptional regulator, partial [Klebsiella pneumoniae]|nr:helix-turn-helix transcriptional regulator [Klebsiella pneumoniae]